MHDTRVCELLVSVCFAMICARARHRGNIVRVLRKQHHAGRRAHITSADICIHARWCATCASSLCSHQFRLTRHCHGTARHRTARLWRTTTTHHQSHRIRTAVPEHKMIAKHLGACAHRRSAPNRQTSRTYGQFWCFQFSHRCESVDCPIRPNHCGRLHTCVPGIIINPLHAPGFVMCVAIFRLQRCSVRNG